MNKRQPSVMNAQAHFSQVPSADIPRSRFDRSHAYKTTMDAGKLVPVFIDEVLPGDTFTMNATQFARLAMPLHPIMDNLYLDLHFFFVPSRLPWDHWQEFMGERKSPNDDPNDYIMPFQEANTGSIQPHSIADYFGIPQVPAGGGGSFFVQALPFAAYYMIWNEWYRDENLQEPINIDFDTGLVDWSFLATSAGNEIGDPATIMPRGKRKDYFTGALPWPQKGDPVSLPLAGYLEVEPGPTAGVDGGLPFGMAVVDHYIKGGGSPQTLYGTPYSGSPTDDTMFLGGQNAAQGVSSPGTPQTVKAYGVATSSSAPAGAMGAVITDLNGIRVDLSAMPAITINDMRTAFQIQKLLERDARGGTRYIEIIFSHFKVRSDDARLQRPEFLGGGTTPVSINPVASTVASTAPQGNLAAIGTAVAKANWSKSFTEHGFIIGLASARADLTYQQGLERFWWRRTRYDHYWPALAHLGEQPVFNGEIYLTGDTDQNIEVFGYQERYAEYRYKPSRITGLLSSLAPSSLDVWHLSQEFGALPELNASFIEETPPIDRVIAVPSEPHFICDFWFDLKCDRPMPVYSVPGLIDHF